jgi:KDO2-lipid IV(A) lauroyltransferase
MDWLLYILARALLGVVQAMPLDWVARMGRLLGGLAYHLDGRHRRVALKNLTMCFGAEKSSAEIQALARENFRRIGENFACAAKTMAMSPAAMLKRVDLKNEAAAELLCNNPPHSSLVIAVGHFGNFEALAQVARNVPGHRGATTYRALSHKGLNRLLLELRKKTGCLYFERRAEGAALRTALRDDKIILGLLSDQHSGDSGARIPFLGHDCNTSKAPAVFALRFNLPLFAAVCYRTRLAHWCIEVSDEIPTKEDNGHPRSIEAIMTDVNRFFEQAVRRDPANWFWVHNRWKPGRQRPAPSKPEAVTTDHGGDETGEEAG